MPDQFHPRLQDDGTMAPRDTIDEQPVVPAPDSTPSEPAPEPVAEQAPAPSDLPPTPTEDDLYYRISKTNRYQDVLRHAQTDPEFDRTIREYAGRKNKREWTLQVEELRGQLSQRERELAELRISQMKPEEIDDRYQRDPAFRDLYKSVLDARQGVDATVEISPAEAVYIDNVVDDAKDMAVALNMPDWRWKQFEQAFEYCPQHQTNEHGFYDHGPDGRFFEDIYPSDPSLARKASIDYFQRVVGADIDALKEAVRKPAQPAKPQEATLTDQPTAAAPAPQSSPAPAPAAAQANGVGVANPALQASPDIAMGSHGGGPGSPSSRYTDEDLRAMDVNARIELVQSLGGRKAMIEAGTLYIPGLSEEVLGRH